MNVQNYINGRYVDAQDGSVMDVIDPCTGQSYTTAPRSSKADVDAAYRAAVTAFPAWSRETPANRQAAMLRFISALEAHEDEFVEAETRNTGKTLAGMRGEFATILEQLRFVAGAARMFEGRGATEYVPGHTSYVRREPVGVIGQVAPWNFPLMMAVWKFAPAVAMGNTVVLKPGDTTPVTTAMMADLVGSFFPPGVLNVVCGDREAGRYVVSHPDAAMVSITGSTRAGLEVAAAAAKDLKRAHLELGGNAPVIIFEDADLEAAVVAIRDAGYYHSGQSCTASSRVLVQESVCAEFIERMSAAASRTVVGTPSDPDAFLGPLDNADQLARVQGLFDRLPDHAKISVGGHRIGDEGYFWAPTVVHGLQQSDELVQEELFAPVVTVQTFTTEEEAIRDANDTEYGLSSSVWTSNHGRAHRVINSLDFGTVWVNAHDAGVSEMPRGGFKHSGYGKDLSVYGMEDYTRIKHVMHNFHV